MQTPVAAVPNRFDQLSHLQVGGSAIIDHADLLTLFDGLPLAVRKLLPVTLQQIDATLQYTRTRYEIGLAEGSVQSTNKLFNAPRNFKADIWSIHF